jgi:hypothetical protein
VSETNFDFSGGPDLRPPGPPGAPTHTHGPGVECWWVRRDGIDWWRRVDPTGLDLGPCPGTTANEGTHVQACDHQWLLRPESDTHQCLFCGDER